MKKFSYILLVSFFILSNSFKPAEEIKWLDFKTGYETAKKKKKLMLVDVYTEWCGWCEVMDRETYAKSEIAAVINESFVPVKFNPEVPAEYAYEGKNYAGKDLQGVISNYQLRGYPATIFINTKTKKTSLVSGYKNPQQFTEVLNGVKTELK
ncbi:MAG: DUF255 domain-containing protein [Bacteroidota bacterium]